MKMKRPLIKESAPQHTPTPWKVDIDYRKATKKTGIYVSTEREPGKLCDDARSIASMTGDYYEDDANIGIRKANAAFIVRAVNSHAALLEAARELLDNMDDSEGSTNEETGKDYPDIAKLRKAIARAEEK